ncbi:sphingolipid delta-4 desaturase [Tilletia horrida]|nr:sphingolipid delta-4 desaturase [Tilletia horrida]
MLGFDGVPRSVDWSLYGGAEQVAPSQRKYLRHGGSGSQGAAQPSLSSSAASLASRSSSSLFHFDAARKRAADNGSSSASSDGGSAVTTPPTSEGEDDDGGGGGGGDVEEQDEAKVEAAVSDQSASSLSDGSGLRSRWTNGKTAAAATAGDLALSSSLAAASSSSRRATSSRYSDSAAGTSAPSGLRWAPEVLPDPQDPSEFLWLLTEEPHRSRRAAILKDHPEIRTLMGHEPLTKWVSLAVVVLQLGLAVFFARAGFSPLDWRFLLTAYVVGGTANQNTFLAIHEITHNLAFKGIRANKLWAILVNAPIGIPYAMMFKRYHIEHHKHLGEDGIDTDLPTKFELMCLKNVLGKAFFATFQIFFYALRPGFVRTQKLTGWHALNIGFQLALDAVLLRAFGATALWYLIASSFFAGSLHPCAAHFIAEHYMFGGIQQETWSYYGPLNILAYNVGYHNEHHDFPSIPWTRLPALKRMAPEYYDVLPFHTSWPMVTLQFILGSDSGLFARIKRAPAGQVHIPTSEQ